MPTWTCSHGISPQPCPQCHPLAAAVVRERINGRLPSVSLGPRSTPQSSRATSDSPPQSSTPESSPEPSADERPARRDFWLDPETESTMRGCLNGLMIGSAMLLGGAALIVWIAHFFRHT